LIDDHVWQEGAKRLASEAQRHPPRPARGTKYRESL